MKQSYSTKSLRGRHTKNPRLMNQTTSYYYINLIYYFKPSFIRN